MHFLSQGIQALRAEARLLWAALRDRRLILSLALFAALLLLAAQAPLRYTGYVAFAYVAGFIVPTPGGLGVREIILQRLLATELAPATDEASDLAWGLTLLLRLLWMAAEVGAIVGAVIVLLIWGAVMGRRNSDRI